MLKDFFVGTETQTLKKIDRLELTCVNLREAIAKEEEVKGLLPMRCFVLNDSVWEQYKFTIGDYMVRMGGSRKKSQIYVKGNYLEDIHVSMQILGRQWFIVEAGVYNNLAINGIKRRQTLLYPYSTSILEVAGVPIVVTSTMKFDEDRDAAILPEYKLRSQAGELAAEINKNLLIGSSDLCDIEVPGEPFAGLICYQNNGFFLYSFMKNCRFKVNGVDTTGLTELEHGSVISYQGEDMTLDLSQITDQNQLDSLFSEYSNTELCLIEIDDESELTEVRELPPSGKSVFLGRSTENFLTVTHDTVSRQHAEIKYSSNSLSVRDCYTRNGTKLNGEKITKDTAKPGDIITFGGKSFLFSYAPVSND
jgi:hypothetical protein